VITCLALVFFFFHSLSPAFAATQVIDSIPISASVPSASSPPIDNQSPSTPILLRPFDGTETADDRPEFAWLQSTDPDGNTLYYDLYLDNSPLYLGISNLGNSATSLYYAYLEGQEIRLKPTVGLSEGSHDWHIRAYDSGNAITNSTTWHFRLDTTPPYILLTTLDNYQNLGFDSRLPDSPPPDTTLEIIGPRNISLFLETEPYTLLQLSFFTPDNELYTSLNVNKQSSPFHELHPWLTVGTYTVTITATDAAGLTTTLPPFTLVVVPPSFTLPPLPPLTSAPLTLTLSPPQALPAPITTISQSISPWLSITITISLLLAIITILLIIYLKYHRPNLLLLNQRHQPLATATLYHSLPGNLATVHHLNSTHHGRVYVPHLTHRSSLTLRPPQTLLVFSLTHPHLPLTLIIPE